MNKEQNLNNPQNQQLNIAGVMPRTLKDRAFAALTKNADDWQIDAYNAYHKPSGIKWWVGNGLLFFHTDGNKNVSIGILNWIKLYYWIKNVKRQQVIDSVYGT